MQHFPSFHGSQVPPSDAKYRFPEGMLLHKILFSGSKRKFALDSADNNILILALNPFWIIAGKANLWLSCIFKAFAKPLPCTKYLSAFAIS